MEFIVENIIYISALVGVIYILAAIITHFFPPKKINHLYGYRTINSMKNQEQWDFAQKFSNKQMLIAGILMILISMIGYFINLSVNQNVFLGLFITIIISVLMILKIENAIKKKFPDK